MDLSQLNEPQKQVVLHGDSPLLVLAGAGTGKTMAVTYRIAYLMHHRGVAPNSILAMTFTNKAARQMRERAGRLSGVDPWGLDMGTFHGMCARLLRQHGGLVGLTPSFVIYDQGDQLTLVKRCAAELNLDAQVFPARSLRLMLEQWKNQGYGPQNVPVSELDPLAKRARDVYALYRKRCLEANAVDFGDLLVHTVALLREDEPTREHCRRRWSHVLVDEYQDTNPVQSALLKLLVTDRHSVTVVGDDDQSIYRWRGADIGNILRFEQDFPGARVIRLEQNYRSTQAILSAANAVIAHNVARKGKTLFTTGAQGSALRLRVFRSDRDEGEAIAEAIETLLQQDWAPSDVGILYRINAQSRVLEDGLRRRRIPYAVYGGVRFYDRREIKDAMAYLRLLLNPRSMVDMLRVVNVPPRGIGKTSLERLGELAGQRGVSLFEAAELAATGNGDGVKLQTRARTRLGGFTAMVRRFGAAAAAGEHLARVLEAYLEESGYLGALRAEDSAESVERLHNLQELVAAVDEYVAAAAEPSLAAFLEEVALATDVDELRSDDGQVALMTLHSAKGLEFNIVFLPGLEDGLFPHSRSLQARAALEEERRLCYVGITRARQQVMLSAAQLRSVFGEVQQTMLSRFVGEIPPELLSTGSADDGSAVSTSSRSRRAAATGASGLPSATGLAPASREPSSGAFPPGTRVFHATFGEGTVVGAEDAGARSKLRIDFPGVGRKVIVARFLDRV